MAITMNVYGDRHPNFATVVNRLGSLYIELDRVTCSPLCYLLF